jgi:hypothetical protein
MKIAARVVLAAVLCVPTSARAGELAGVGFPDQVTVEGKSLVLNGLGLREATLLKVDVYVAGLYLEAKSTDPQAILGSELPRRIVMRFVRDVKRQDLVKAWTEGFEKNAGKEMPALKERLATLNAAMPDVANGDTLAFTYLPGVGVRVEVRGETKATIAGPDFARVLFGIWLGPNPPNPGLKDGLLGAGAPAKR